MSGRGRPASVGIARSTLKRRPRACSAERSRFSGAVSRRLLRMLRDTAGLDAGGAAGTADI